MKSNYTTYNHSTKESLDIYLTSLIEEKTKLADESKYLEAETLKRRINELRQKIDLNNKKALEEHHQVERLSLEENYKKEIEEYETNWNRKLEEFRLKEKSEVEALILNQNKEIEAIQDLIQQTFKPKPSKEFLQLLFVEKLMKKQERYEDANYIKNRLIKLAKEEEEKNLIEKERLFKQKLENLFKKHQNEKNYISEKFVIEYLVMKKTKDDELSQMYNRFKNMQLNLEIQQKQEKFLAENEKIMKAKSLSRLNMKLSCCLSKSKYFSYNSTQDFSKKKLFYDTNKLVDHITE